MGTFMNGGDFVLASFTLKVHESFPVASANPLLPVADIIYHVVRLHSLSLGGSVVFIELRCEIHLHVKHLQ